MARRPLENGTLRGIERALPFAAVSIAAAISIGAIARVGAAGDPPPSTWTRIQAWIALLSGDAVHEPVPIVLVERGELDAVVQRDRREDSPALRRAARDRVLAELGVLPRDLDRESVELAVVRATDARYDAAERRVLVAREAAAGGTGPVAREIARAMLDRRVGLARFLAAQRDDERLARAAVVEGLTRFLAGRTLAAHATEVAETLPRDGAERLLSREPRDALVRAGAPDFTIAIASLPAERGVAFVERVFAEEKAAGLERVLQDPPRSTEQVLHPEKWLGAIPKDEPVALTASTLGERLPDEWRAVFEGDVGELEAHVVLRLAGDPVRALRAAEGLDGDRLAAYSPGAGEALLVEWSAVLDSDDDAKEWVDALRRLLERRYGPGSSRVPVEIVGEMFVETDADRTRVVAKRRTSEQVHAIARRGGSRVDFLLCDAVDLDLASLLQ